MAAETLSVRKDGAWKPVIYPWVRDNHTWKQIHKVHVRSGGAWKVAHRTAWGDYTERYNNTYLTAQNITVPAGVHYWKVIIIGHGGGGGGGAGASAHHECGGSPSPGNSTHYHVATPTAGGPGGYADAIFEVQEGSKYYWGNTGDTTGPAGGAGNSEYFNTNSEESGMTNGYSHVVGETVTGNVGSSYDILFRTDTSVTNKGNVSIDANGGGGGSKGTITVTTRCSSISGRVGYTLANSNTGVGSTGTASVSSTGVIEEQTTTSGGGHPGGAAGGGTYPPSDGSASSGGSGSVQIIQYGL